MSGNIQRTQLTPLTQILTGKKTLLSADPAAAIGGNIPIRSIVVRALSGNTNDVLVGSSVAQDYELSPGESVAVDIDNVNKVFINTSFNGDGVSWLILRIAG